MKVKIVRIYLKYGGSKILAIAGLKPKTFWSYVKYYDHYTNQSPKH